MSSSKDRVAIIALDGLSATQFEILQSRMPAMKSLLKNGSVAEFQAAPFSDAQPIWAEILTGQPWYRNGCSGYAVPLRSLNEMRIFTELDLRTSPCLLPSVATGQRNVVVNVPLLLPKPEERVWIADGSSPGVSSVSPEKLLKENPFKAHRPRPIISMGIAMADSFAFETLISTEINRLDCALACLEQPNCRTFIYRASIFDQLAHLLGPAFLSEPQLQISSRIEELLAKLDQGISEIISKVDKYLILSAFSHTACKEMFSLNDLFQNAGLLHRSDVPESNQSRLRREAFAIVSNSDEGNPLVSPIAQFSTDRTICASPTRATIFLNTKMRFTDGIVEEADLHLQKKKVARLLNEEIGKLRAGKIFEVPENQENDSAPQFVISAPSVDLVENLGTVKRNCELPHSVHDSTGFVWTKGVQRHVVKSVEIIHAIAE